MWEYDHNESSNTFGYGTPPFCVWILSLSLSVSLSAHQTHTKHIRRSEDKQQEQQQNTRYKRKSQIKIHKVKTVTKTEPKTVIRPLRAQTDPINTFTIIFIDRFLLVLLALACIKYRAIVYCLCRGPVSRRLSIAQCTCTCMCVWVRRKCEWVWERSHSMRLKTEKIDFHSLQRCCGELSHTHKMHRSFIVHWRQQKPKQQTFWWKISFLIRVWCDTVRCVDVRVSRLNENESMANGRTIYSCTKYL